MKVQGFELRCYEKVTIGVIKKVPVEESKSPDTFMSENLNHSAILALSLREGFAFNYIKSFHILKSMKIQGFKCCCSETTECHEVNLAQLLSHCETVTETSGSFGLYYTLFYRCPDENVF